MPRARLAAIALASALTALPALTTRPAHGDPPKGDLPKDDPPKAAPAPQAAPNPGAREAPYPLDSVSRSAPESGALPCPKVEIENYRGDVVKMQPPVWIYTGFRPRVAALERVARDVGIEVYGRAPSRVVNLGGYGCRRMRSYSTWLSEHALGNAIDIAGFDFGHLQKGEKLALGLDKSFANGFEVSVLRHWGKKTGHAAVHARYLRTLIERLAARDDAFRVLLGPGFPGHKNHFHFDMATFRLLQVFEHGQLVGAPPASKQGP